MNTPAEPQTTVTTLEIVGREEELAAVAGFLADTDSLPRLLLMEGEPGIGKTTIWRYAIEEGRGIGYRVLPTRPGRSEAQLAFAGVSDLVEGSLDGARGRQGSGADRRGVPRLGRAHAGVSRRCADAGLRARLMSSS